MAMKGRKNFRKKERKKGTIKKERAGESDHRKREIKNNAQNQKLLNNFNTIMK